MRLCLICLAVLSFAAVLALGASLLITLRKHPDQKLEDLEPSFQRRLKLMMLAALLLSLSGIGILLVRTL